MSTDKGLSEAERTERPIVADQRVTHFSGPYSLTYSSSLARIAADTIADADIVHVHGIDNYASVTGMRIAAAAEVPFVVQPHGAWDAYHRDQGRVKKAVWGVAFQDRWLAKAKVAVASSSREAVGVSEAHPGMRTGHVPLGVSENLFEILTPWDERSGVLFLGRIARKKRLDLALSAFAEARRTFPELRMTVAGRAEADIDFSPLALAQDLGIADAVTFVGTVDATTRLHLLASHRAFILPSEDESFGIAAAEAAAAGLAIVASDKVGAIADAGTATVGQSYVVESGDFGGALVAALGDSGKQQTEILRDFAATHWRWSLAARKTIDVYEMARS